MQKKLFNILITLFSIFFFFSCASTKTEDIHLTINDKNGSTFEIQGAETCDRLKVIFEGDLIPENIEENFYCMINNKKYMFTHFEYLPYSNALHDEGNQYTLYESSNNYYTHYPTSDEFIVLKKNNITNLTLYCNKKLKYDSVEVLYKFHDCRITFTNANYLRPSDENVLAKCGVNITGKEISNVTFNQLKNLLNNDTSNFYSNYLGNKTALQWKVFWESDEGKDYYDLFVKTKERIQNERISSEINLVIGEYDLEKGYFNGSYQNRYNNFIIKNGTLKVFEKIKLSEQDALKIENLKGGWSNKFSTKINYLVSGIKEDKIEIYDIRLDFIKNDDNSIICSCQLTEDDNPNTTKNISNPKEQKKQYFDFNKMYAQTVIDIFENTIFDVFKTDLQSYDTELKKKMFLESKESDIYKNEQIVAKKKIIEEGIENIIPNYKFSISNYDTKTNTFYITIGQNFIDKVLYTHNSMLTGPDKTINDFYYDKLNTKNIDGNYCLEWKIKDLNKALEIENQKNNIEIKLNAKIDSIKKIVYNRNDIFIDHTDKSSWSVRLPNCTTMKLTIYNSKTNEIYEVFDF